MEHQSSKSCKKCVFKGYKQCPNDQANEALWIRVIEHCESCIDKYFEEMREMNSLCFPELGDEPDDEITRNYEN